MNLLNKAKDGVINLGTANGWNKETNEQYQALRELMIPGSQHSRELSRCYNEYTFNANIEGETYTVIHTIDSGD